MATKKAKNKSKSQPKDSTKESKATVISNEEKPNNESEEKSPSDTTEAEKKRLEEEAEAKKLAEEESEKKRLEEEAETKRLADEEAEKKRLEEEAQEPDNRFPIVIPFKESAAKGNELMYALRAWDKHFPNVRIFIVGDFPKWVKESDDLVHIPHKSVSKNPQIDVAEKMLTVCNSELVPDYFGWSNDDIYPTSPVTVTDIDLLTAEGRLGKRGSVGSVYRENAARTLKALNKAGIKQPYDFATHTPVVFYKEELKAVIDTFKCTKEGHLVSTLYFNTQWQGHIPVVVDNGARNAHDGTRSYVASVFRKVSPDAVKKAFTERKFINNNDVGWSSVEPILKTNFPDKCRFEK